MKKFLYVNNDADYEESSGAYETSDFISSSAGAADAGKPIVLDSNGQLDGSFIDDSDIDHGNLSGLADDDHTQYIRVDGTRAFTGDQSLGSNKLTNVADPTADQDAATKAYVDTALDGRKWKQSCKVATTANITLSGTQTIDGIAVSAGDRVLVKDQTTASENGIYIVDSGAWSRSSDANTATELEGAAVFVEEGNTSADYQFAQTSDNITLGTTSINWVVSSANSLSGHDMITLTGGDISVDLATSSGLESTNPGNAAGQLKVKVEASNPSLAINGSNELGVNLDSAGAILSGANGLATQVDDSSIEISSNALQVKADGINDTHIDFGTGTNQVNAEDIPVIDTNNNFTTDNVEAALAELANQIVDRGVTYTAGTGGVTKGDVVYISGNDTVLPWSTLSTAHKTIGLAFTTQSAGNDVTIAANDTVIKGVLSGATAGTPYYWDGSNLTSTKPVTSGWHLVQAGVAKNATDLHVECRIVKRNS